MNKKITIAQGFIKKISTVGVKLDKDNEDSYPVEMTDITEEICCAGIDWHYNEDNSFNVLFEDESCVKVANDGSSFELSPFIN